VVFILAPIVLYFNPPLPSGEGTEVRNYRSGNVLLPSIQFYQQLIFLLEIAAADKQAGKIDTHDYEENSVASDVINIGIGRGVQV
jgi:hypothetical protein